MVLETATATAVARSGVGRLLRQPPPATMLRPPFFVVNHPPPPSSVFFSSTTTFHRRRPITTTSSSSRRIEHQHRLLNKTESAEEELAESAAARAPPPPPLSSPLSLKQQHHHSLLPSPLSLVQMMLSPAAAATAPTVAGGSTTAVGASPPKVVITNGSAVSAAASSKLTLLPFLSPPPQQTSVSPRSRIGSASIGSRIGGAHGGLLAANGSLLANNGHGPDMCHAAKRRCFSTSAGSTTSSSSSSFSSSSSMGGGGGGGTPTGPPASRLFQLDRSRKGIVVGLMNNPGTKNAMSRVFLREMREALEELRFDTEARVLILKSVVPGTFCTGADLKERRAMPAEEVPKSLDEIRRTVHGFAAHPLPILAAIEGYALGGGLELALACDIRVASPTAKVGLPETKLAIIPGAGGTQRLSRIIGLALAKELILTGRVIPGEEALRIGLVNHLVEDPFSKCLEIADEILKTGPIASRLAKLAIDEGFQVEMNTALHIEQQCYAQTIGTKDRREALEAFAAKRPPVYRGE